MFSLVYNHLNNCHYLSLPYLYIYKSSGPSLTVAAILRHHVSRVALNEGTKTFQGAYCALMVMLWFDF